MIGILNYGVGNLKAFSIVLKGLHTEYSIVDNEKDLKNCDKIILPGVGSFDSVMKRLNESGLKEVLSEQVLQNKIPVLGVCVGMQILAKSSEEGELEGLGWIPSRVVKFSFKNLSIPQIGWNEVKSKGNSKLFNNLNSESRFYFLHSYYIHCENNEHILAETDYGGNFTCAVGRENIFGVQFHPEKSHHNGVALIKNFTEI